jgi:hypothetical protein
MHLLFCISDLLVSEIIQDNMKILFLRGHDAEKQASLDVVTGAYLIAISLSPAISPYPILSIL